MNIEISIQSAETIIQALEEFVHTELNCTGRVPLGYCRELNRLKKFVEEAKNGK